VTPKLLFASVLLFCAAACSSAAAPVDGPLPETAGSSSESLVLQFPDNRFYVSRLSFHDLAGGDQVSWFDGTPPVAPSKTWKLAAVLPQVGALVTIHIGPEAPVWLESGYCNLVSPSLDGVPVTALSVTRPDKWTLRFYVDLSRTPTSDTPVLGGSVTCGGGVQLASYPIASTPIALVRTSAFAAMNSTFDHPRCRTCHSIGDGQAWIDFHANFFPAMAGMTKDEADAIDVSAGHVSWAAQHPGQLQPPQNPFYEPNGELSMSYSSCPGCHGAVADWRAPPFSMGIDWKKVVTPSERCQVVRDHLPTAEQRNHHFRDDPRLLWSYYDGTKKCSAVGLDLPYLPEAKGQHIPFPNMFRSAEELWSADTVFGLPSCANLTAPRKPTTTP
jgi:hypothetical protein